MADVKNGFRYTASPLVQMPEREPQHDRACDLFSGGGRA